MGEMLDIQTKRVYEPVHPEDGLRVLVDRVWPRGLTKAQVQADLWMKDLAPNTALRKWFGHDRTKWQGFKQQYFSQLDAQPNLIAKILTEAKKRRVTLLFSARDVENNQAVALKEYLLTHFDP